MVLEEVMVDVAGRVSMLFGPGQKSLRGVTNVPDITARLTAVKLVHHVRLVLGRFDGSVGEC